MITSDRPLVNRLTCPRNLEQASPSLGLRYTVKPVLSGHLQLNSTTQHARYRKRERLPRIATYKFFDFYFKKHDLTNSFD